MSKIIVNEIESKNLSTTPVNIKADIDITSGKVLKINNTTVLTSTHVHGKSMPSGSIVGHNDEQTLYSKNLAGFTLSGDMTVNAAVDIDLVGNNASALSFDSANKAGILELVTTTGSEKVKMSNGLDLASGKSYEINGAAVLSADEVLGAITRKTNALANDGTASISTLFGSQVSGSYRFFDLNDPRISGTIFLKHNGPSSDPDVRVDSNSSTVSITINTASSLNVYIASNVVTFQNKTGSAVSLVVYKEV